MTLIIKGDFSRTSNELLQNNVVRIIGTGKNVTLSSNKNLQPDNKARLNVLIINREKKTTKRKITGRHETSDENNKKMRFSWCRLIMSFSFWIELIIRVGLFALDQYYLYSVPPFEREITTAEIGLYSYPQTASYISTNNLWIMVFGLPLVLIIVTYLIRRSNADLWNSFLTASLTLGLNACITDAIKAVVGRPRPDFLSRCFNDFNFKHFFIDLPANGVLLTNLNCTGDPRIIMEGRRSFPSGHSSFAFAAFTFAALYVAGKLHTFDGSSLRQGWKICLFWLPFVCSSITALTRTCDYHHHWQDVSVGALLGSTIAYTCYRFYYPALNSHLCHKPHSASTGREKTKKKSSSCLLV